MVLWQAGELQIEFTESEFEELLLKLKTEGLFALLGRQRPALRDQLIAIFWPQTEALGFALSDLEGRLEAALFDLSARL